MPAKKYHTEEERKEAGRAAARRWAARNREKAAQWQRDNAEKVARYNANYEASHRVERRAYRRQKYAEDPARFKQVEAAWRAANLEAVRERARLRHAADPFPRRNAVQRRRTVEKAGDLTLADWREILEAFQGRCAYCLADGPMEPDHLVPIKSGGQHTRSNIVPACRSCNASKGAKSLLVYLMAA